MASGSSAASALILNSEGLERRACPLRLRILALGFARHRRNLERGDAVALTPQHAEAEPVESKALAAVGDRARLVDHEACDGGRLLVRQMPVHGAVEVPDRH